MNEEDILPQCYEDLNLEERLKMLKNTVSEVLSSGNAMYFNRLLMGNIGSETANEGFRYFERLLERISNIYKDLRSSNFDLYDDAITPEEIVNLDRMHSDITRHRWNQTYQRLVDESDQIFELKRMPTAGSNLVFAQNITKKVKELIEKDKYMLKMQYIEFSLINDPEREELSAFFDAARQYIIKHQHQNGI